MNPNYALPTFGGYANGLDQGILGQSPTASYARWSNSFSGVPQQFKDFLSANYGKYYADYSSEYAKDPTKSFLDYLYSGKVNPVKDFYDMTPQQRGDNVGNYTGRIRYVGFS